VDILAHRALGDGNGGKFVAEPLMDAVSGVTLLARRLPILFQDAINESLHQLQPGTGANRRLALRWQGTLQGLTHHAPMYAELARRALNGALAPLILTSNLFE